MKPRLPWSGRATRLAFPAAAALAVLALVLIPLACKRKAPVPRLLSVVEMSNSQAETQLLDGFYGLEAGAWRWTRRQFRVLLAAPPGAAQNGAWLRVRVTAPDALIAKLGDVTLSASLDGHPLPPETYSAAGSYTYARAVPAAFLQGQSATVDFSLDKVMPPSGRDIRELGIVVLSAGLQPE